MPLPASLPIAGSGQGGAQGREGGGGAQRWVASICTNISVFVYLLAYLAAQDRATFRPGSHGACPSAVNGSQEQQGQASQLWLFYAHLIAG
jgi:hypothetical protein